jgi:hypothetical protein
MAALDTATHKVIVSETANLADARPVDGRVLLERLLSDMGLSAFVISNTTPATGSRDKLWWHKDVKQAKRYNPVTGNWFQVTPGQHALHLMQQAFGAGTTDTVIEPGDLFAFYDVSLKETKLIDRDNMIKQIAGKALWNWSKISANTVAVDRGAYLCDTTAGTFTLTLPAAPANYTAIRIADAADFNLNNLIVARNGSTIAGLAENMNVDLALASFELVAFSGDWRIT